MADQRIEPAAVADLVERYISSELHDVEKYENRELLDYSGVYGLHRLAAEIYAIGWADSEQSSVRRDMAARQRERDEQRRCEKPVAAPETTGQRRLCAHADLDGRGMHYLLPGEKCESPEYRTTGEPE